ncbi:MAG TPA: MerR family transcriptional regulator [Burkholderiales bacterium]|nr:MerR family transcriptional regulator [Burkholderiales bacterium]
MFVQDNMSVGEVLTISALERELGIGKDTLRVWERRYGFPSPSRNARGERLYPPEQVARLRLVRRLMDQGMRPHKALRLPPEELALLSRAAAPGGEDADRGLLPLLKLHDPLALQRELRQMLMRDGLHRFVTDTAVPMVAAIGRWWERGEIEVFEEHLITEQLHRVLREAVSQITAAGGRPSVLLTTLPNEPHGLGLLLAESLMRLDGASCTPLGAQTPEGQIAAAVHASGSNIVALSFSDYFPAVAMRESIHRLREALPREVEIWCGGAGAGRLKRAPAGVLAVTRLQDIEPQLARWRKAASPGIEGRSARADG